VTTLDAVIESLRGFVPSDEADLGDQIAGRLAAKGVEFEREVWLNNTDRIDFLVGGVGLELKLKGPVSAVTRQLMRYAQSERVSSLVLVTTRHGHKSVPRELAKKPVAVAVVGGCL
jgi:hypothetical protein